MCSSKGCWMVMSFLVAYSDSPSLASRLIVGLWLMSPLHILLHSYFGCFWVQHSLGFILVCPSPLTPFPLTVMARLVSGRGLFQNTSRIFENGVGPSGCLVASPRKRPTCFRESMAFDRWHLCASGVQGWELWSSLG